MARDTRGYTIKNTWDVLGMRATSSHDTALDGAFVPDKYIARVVGTGAAGIDLFVLAIFAWAEPMFGNIYYAMAQRAFDWTIENVKKKTSLAMSRSMAHHAEVQHAIADMALELEAIGPHLDRIAQDWSDGVDHGHSWGAKLVAVKHHAVEGAWKVVDTAMDLAGGFGIFKQATIERLFRDARLGRIHPANAFLTREFVAKTALGIHIDETPRWG
jgi:alkylation response protein AidB-like acyl-CoA dehydrogenase